MNYEQKGNLCPHLGWSGIESRDVEADISSTASASNRTWTLSEPGLYLVSHLWTCWQEWLSKPAAYDLQGHITC